MKQINLQKILVYTIDDTSEIAIVLCDSAGNLWKYLSAAKAGWCINAGGSSSITSHINIRFILVHLINISMNVK